MVIKQNKKKEKIALNLKTSVSTEETSRFFVRALPLRLGWIASRIIPYDTLNVPLFAAIKTLSVDYTIFAEILGKMYFNSPRYGRRILYRSYRPIF